MANILITGSSGFIGSHLVDSQVEQGHTVRAVDIHPPHTETPLVEWVTGDIADPGLAKTLVKDIDVVFHLASAHLDVSLGDADYRRVNVAGTIGLIEAARSAGVKRFVHCSSVGVMGDILNPPADESASCNPENIYEKTKYEGERAAVAFARETGFPVVVARPAWVYGPRCPRTAKLFRMIRKGRFFFFGAGGNFRHPIYISDAVRGFAQCAESDLAPGAVYILAGSRPVTTKELADAIAETMGVRAPRLQFPMLLGRLAGRILEGLFTPLGKSPPFSSRSMDFYTKNNAYDIQKARQDFQFDPVVDLRTGLAQTWQWMQANQ